MLKIRYLACVNKGKVPSKKVGSLFKKGGGPIIGLFYKPYSGICSMHDQKLLTPSSAVRPVRAELADTFLLEGETALVQGDLDKGTDCFESALKLDPENPKLHFAQGLSLFDFASRRGDEKILALACKRFKAATSRAPRYFEAWQAWGSALCLLGQATNKHHYFKEAKEKLTTALSLSQNQGKEALSELYWDLGVVYSKIAERSLEALDWHQSIQAFELAHSFDERLSADFWRDFGSSCLQFSKQLCDNKLLIKAIQCLKKATTLEPKGASHFHTLGLAMQQLYEETHDEDHFAQSSSYLQSAVELQPLDPLLLLDWARLLCGTVGSSPSLKRLRLCIEKCHAAFNLDPSNPLILALWGEALSLLGEKSDRLDLLLTAEDKLIQALEKEGSNPEIFYSYGICMQAFGRYFDDADYYYQAIEKFQEGLSLDRTHGTLWHAIASVYAFLGERTESEEELTLSLRFFQKALSNTPSTYTLFEYARALSILGEIYEQESYLEQALAQFERLWILQKNALYLHPHWLERYATTLDLLGGYNDEEFYYHKAIETYSSLLLVDPESSSVHHHMGLALSHLAELTGETTHFHRAVHHYRLSLKHQEENDVILIDWATTLMSLACQSYDSAEADQLYRDAEYKLMQALNLGNLHTYYSLACLYSLTGECDQGIYYLKRAHKAEALPALQELLDDAWLDNVRSTSAFQELLNRID